MIVDVQIIYLQKQESIVLFVKKVFKGEEYIENYRNEFVHFECVRGIRWLLNWLDYEIQEENYENDH